MRMKNENEIDTDAAAGAAASAAASRETTVKTVVKPGAAAEAAAPSAADDDQQQHLCQFHFHFHFSFPIFIFHFNFVFLIYFCHRWYFGQIEDCQRGKAPLRIWALAERECIKRSVHLAQKCITRRR